MAASPRTHQLSPPTPRETHDLMASNADKKNEARLKREQAQAAAAAKAKRAKTLQYLAGAVFAAILVVVLVVVITGGKDGGGGAADGGDVKGKAETTALLKDIPNTGFTIGDPKAPVTVIEFIDLQCPFCKEEQLDGQPELINDLVRTGKVKLRLVPLGFLGPDSVDSRVVMTRLAAENKAWAFANLFYWNQGDENTGYVTDEFLTDITTAAGGTAAQATNRTPSEEEAKTIASFDELQKQLLPGGPSTPTYAVGKTGQEPSTFTVVKPGNDGYVAAVKKAVEEQSAESGT